MARDNSFTFGGKALSTQTQENGDLIIEGFASVFAGDDRQGENFAPGAFKDAIRAFLGGPASLCFHHKAEKVLGKVLELEELPNVGLRMVARVDGAIRYAPDLAHIYAQIKKGTLTGLSIGGFFKRALTAAGKRIVAMDFTEISVTPVPTHAQPAFSVVEGKAIEAAALMRHVRDLEWLREQLVRREQEQALWIASARIDLAETLLAL